jgi:hypothetical protein
VSALTTVFGPIAQILILLGNALTPGAGFADGPFASRPSSARSSTSPRRPT